MNGLKKAVGTFALAAILLLGVALWASSGTLFLGHSAKVQRLLAPAEQPNP